MCTPPKSPDNVVDHVGWVYSLSAVLKRAFGTDTEVRIRSHGGILSEIANAKEEVGRMNQGAENLLMQMDVPIKDDETTEGMEDLLRQI